MAKVNRKWVLAQRPKGMVKTSDFELKEDPIPEIKDGEFLIKNLYLSFDPAQRGWMNEGGSYVAAIPLGEPVRALGVGEVVESKNDHFKKGDLVSGLLGWQEYAISKGEGNNKLFPGLTPTLALSACGMVALTAYFGLFRIGELKEGETVVVSGAAGATGSVAGQIAKIKNCRVIGIAGGPDKCKWLKDDLHFDDVIDYKSENVQKRLKELTPKGIDVYFDNVGGEILEAALANMAMFGRIIVCGGISGYNEEESPRGPKNYLQLISKRIKMQGFIVMDYVKEYPSAVKELFQWVQEGKLKTKEDIQEGFENIPNTFLRLFSGANTGKQLLKL